MDIAELGFVSHDEPLDRSAKKLDKLTDASGKAEVATDKYNKKAVQSTGVVNNLAKGFSGLQAVVAKLGAVLGVVAIVGYSNAWTDLTSRVDLATGSIGLAEDTMSRLSDMARMTYSPLEQTAEIFLQNSTALRELGKSTNSTLDYVEAMNNALVVSGAKGMRAESVMNALNKSMGIGKLSGENLNTVLASGGRITQLIAEQLGVTTNQLRGLGAEGKITGDVIYKALVGNLEKLRAEAESMPATIGDALGQIGNGLMRMVGVFDQARGTSAFLAEAILSVADAMNDGTISIERILSYATAAALFMGGAWVASFVAANGAVGALTLGLYALRTALIRTGIGILIVLAGELVHQLFKVVDGADSLESAFGRLKKSGIDTWERLVDGGRFMWHSTAGFALNIAAAYTKTWATILSGFGDMVRGIESGWNAVLRAFGQAEVSFGFTEALDRQFAEAERLSAAALVEVAAAKSAWERMFQDKSTYDEVGSLGTFDKFLQDMGLVKDKVPPILDEVSDKAEKAAASYAKIVSGANQFIESQKLEASVLGMTSVQAQTLRNAQDLLNDAQSQNIALTPYQRQELLYLAESMATTEDRTNRLTEAYKFGQDTLRSFLSDLRTDLMNGTSLWQSFGNAAVGVLNKIADKATQMLADGIWNMIFSSIAGGIGGGTGTAIASVGASIMGRMGSRPFSEGGYTGDGSRSGVAGVVHGQEYVLNADATRRIGVDNLNAMNDNRAIVAPTSNGATHVTFAPNYNISGLGLSAAEVQEIVRNSNQQMLDDLPDVIEQYQADPRKRTVRAH
jgi:tape measure domain-containing protein